MLTIFRRTSVLLKILINNFKTIKNDYKTFMFRYLYITFLFFALLFISIASCDNNHKEVLFISGNILNLPDGTMYLCKDNNTNIIDSVETKNGKFIFKYKLDDEPIYLTIHHLDKNNIFRMISFPTKAYYNKSKFNSSSFISDSIVTIYGSFTDNTPLGLRLDNKTIFVTSPEIKGGYQINAMFHTDGDLFDNINKDSFKKIVSLIKEYPNSFHLLYQINKNRNSFTVNQTQDFLNLFKGKITHSETYKNLKIYNQKRFDKKKITIPFLTDHKGNKTKVLDTKFKKHLVIFWASWCGPCRQEIPFLKKLYSVYKNDIEFVSISTDTNYSLWHKALAKEQMSWKQFVVNEKSKEYEEIEILFQVNNSIPYIALIDNNMKVLKSHVGLIGENELDNFLND